MWSKLSANPDLVGEREGHCSCVLPVGDSQLLVVFGGFCEGEFRREVIAAVVDDALLNWFVAGEYDFCETDGMSMSTQPVGRNPSLAPNEAVLFGGLEASSYAPVNVVRRLSLTAVAEGTYVTTVTEVTAGGNLPSPRWRHSATIMNNYLYIFGGVTAGCDQNSDLFRFELSLGLWEQVDVSLSPPPRFLAVLLPTNACLVLHGGGCFENGEQASLCDLWTFDPSAQQWEEISVPGWPRVNGHCGFARSVSESLAEVYFHGGKDFSEGTDDVLKLTMSFGDQGRVVNSARITIDGAPHWRYTASSAVLPLQSNEVMFFVVGGQCRHNDPTSTYCLCL